MNTTLLLTPAELMIVMDGLPTVKASIVSNNLKKRLFINDKYLYILNPELVVYTKTTKIKEELCLEIALLLQNSFMGLDSSFTELITNKFKNYKSIFLERNICEYITEVIRNLTRNDFKPDLTLNEIHFLNGYIDLRTKIFQKRNPEKHFISLTINREYKPSTKKQQEELMKDIKKIYPIREDRCCILRVFGSAFTGHSISDNAMLILIGVGSTGKSFILSLTLKAFQIYVKELKDDAFSKNNPNVNKILNSYDSEPTARISWINEMKDKRIDDSLLKQFTEGQVSTTKLYKEGDHVIHHHSLLIATMNQLLNIKMDSGTSRRIRSYTHGSYFTDDVSKVNEAQHIYLKDKTRLEKIIDNGLLDAWVDILVEEAYQWNKNRVISYTQSFKNSTEEVIASNDFFKDFVEVKLELTGNENDKIHKDEMMSFFKEMYPTKHYIQEKHLLSSLKDKSIPYNANLRKMNFETRGCYFGVKQKGREDFEPFCQFEFLELQKKYKMLEEKNNVLEQKIMELQELFAMMKEDKY